MYRRDQKRHSAETIESLSDKIKNIEQTLSRQVVPVGYEFRIVGGQLVIYRISDGATAVLL